MTLAQEATKLAMYSSKPVIDWTSDNEPTDQQLIDLIKWFRDGDIFYKPQPEGWGLAE